MAFFGAAMLAMRYLGRRGGLQGLFGGAQRRFGQQGRLDEEAMQRGAYGQTSGMGDASSIAQSSPYGSGVERRTIDEPLRR